MTDVMQEIGSGQVQWGVCIREWVGSRREPSPAPHFRGSEMITKAVPRATGREMPLAAVLKKEVVWYRRGP